MRLMTYNILNNNPKFSPSSPKHWGNRKNKVLQVIQEQQPDILCIQEGKPNQIALIKTILPEHQYYGKPSHHQGKGEHVGIFFNRNHFELQQEQTFWLSKTPEQCSKDWNSAHPRICSFVRLQHKTTQQSYFIFNTHLDHKSSQARLEGIKVILNRIETIQQQFPQVAIFLTGDFNANLKKAPYKAVVEGHLLVDSFYQNKTKSSLSYTFTGIYKKWCREKLLLHFFYPNFMHQRLDYIFVSNNVHVLQYQIINTAFNGCYPSDHLPVCIDFRTKVV